MRDQESEIKPAAAGEIINPESSPTTMLHLFKNILWDHQLSDAEILGIYRGETTKDGLDEIGLKARLLNSYNWYTLVRELGREEAGQLMKPEIIERLYPKSLRQSYLYAASILRK